MVTCNNQISSRCFPSESVTFISIRKEHGFTLVELALVLIVLGILVAMTIPKLMTVTTKSKDGEARTILAAIYTLEITFKDHNGRYTSNLDSLDYADTGIKYWTGPVFIPVPTETTFTAFLIEKGDMDGDKKYENTKWTVTQESREATISGR